MLTQLEKSADAVLCFALCFDNFSPVKFVFVKTAQNAHCPVPKDREEFMWQAHNLS